LEALGFLRTLDLVHTDLKPENILLVDDTLNKRTRLPERWDVKLIDFGNAVYLAQNENKLICTREYRPPEVVLGLSWDFSADYWSLGCILAELVSGVMLFHTYDDYEQLAMVERAIGRIPVWMAKATSGSKRLFFDRYCRFNWPARCLTVKS
jgi:serine/threonine protein kinase